MGKTTLLTRFANQREGIYFYGTRATEGDVLKAFSHQAADLLENDYLRQAPFPQLEDGLNSL